MRIVHNRDEFADAFMSAQREVASSFGVNTILLEKYIMQPRHAEFQVWVLILLYFLSHLEVMLFDVHYVTVTLIMTLCPSLFFKSL